ncbi:MAG: STAS domain-containing protein [Bernardetiaceae bacterium]|jgi:anti-anti-sigma factor|nr:STAS domain-containing protein [Bernardetiaceae bacterium]
MKLTVEKHDKYTLITLQEEKLNTLVAPQLKTEFVTLFQANTVNLILDLAQVKYVDSSGLSALLVANRLAKEVHGLLVLAQVQEHAHKLIALSKLDAVLTLLPSVPEAVDAVFLHELAKDLHQGGAD